jgi:hypothetical protein
MQVNEFMVARASGFATVPNLRLMPNLLLIQVNEFMVARASGFVNSKSKFTLALLQVLKRASTEP